MSTIALFGSIRYAQGRFAQRTEDAVPPVAAYPVETVRSRARRYTVDSPERRYTVRARARRYTVRGRNR